MGQERAEEELEGRQEPQSGQAEVAFAVTVTIQIKVRAQVAVPPKRKEVSVA